MTKVVGKIFNATMGAGVGFIVGGGKGALQGLSNFVSALSGPVAFALNVGRTVLAGSGGGGQKRQAEATSVTIGEGPREALFGKAAAGGTLLDAFNYGGKYSTDWEVLVLALADHRCDALEGFYIGDTYVAYTGDGPVAGYKGQLEVYWRPGTEDQTPPAVLTSNGGWSSNDRLRGVAYVVIAYKADASDAKAPVWTSGRPSFLWVVRGALVYDPRKDSTVPGGSGPHRWADPSTREWSENAELCRYAYDRGLYACDRVDQPAQLLIGRGLSAIEAPPERIFTAANLCDEDVALAAGGSEKRYRVGGVISADEEFGDVAELFAAAMGGIVIQPEGGVGVEPGHGKSPVAYITDDDLVAGTKVTFSDFRSEADDEWCNTVAPRYVEPTQKWADHAAPIRRHSADLIADGGPREAALTLRLVTSGTQSQRIGEIRRRLGRLLRTANLTVGPPFCELEEGDWIVWTSARRTKGVPVTFRVESYALGREWRNALSLREISAACFSWSTSDEIANGATAEAQTPRDGYGYPDPGTWTLTGGAVVGADGSTQPVLIVTGAVEDVYVSEVRFEYRPHIDGQPADAGWIDPIFASPDVTERRFIVASGISYDAAVSYRFPGGVPGDRLILTPATSGDLSVPGASRGAYTLKGSSVTYPLTPVANIIHIAEFTATLDDGKSYSFAANSLFNLADSTKYGAFCERATGDYFAAAYPASDALASSANIFIGWAATPDAAGAYPATPTPPPGYGGDGASYTYQQPQTVAP